MASKTKTYEWVKFPPELIIQALSVFERYIPDRARTGKGTRRELQLANGDDWQHNTDEEHFADYRKDECVGATWRSIVAIGPDNLSVLYHVVRFPMTQVSVHLPERYQVEQVFEVFEAGAARARVGPPVVLPVIFIGHGGNPQWMALRDHLRDQQGFDCVVFEAGPRTGRITKNVVESMADAASFAVFVHSAEDEQADGSKRARENVVHETGFFQGRLGFERAIILREEGCEDFSNIAGVQEIRFHAGNIRETFGEVVAAIRREFP
jgi:hypothetical protein